MNPLKTEEWRVGMGTTTMKIDGFSDQELDDLNKMDYRDMKEAVLDELDKRNHGLGSVWFRGYGVYNAWIREKSVYMEIGNSCD